MTAEKAYELMRNAFTAERYAQAYIIAAPPRGSGGALVEKMLQWFFCNASPRGCGECADCRRVAEHAVPDLLWIEPQMKSRQISVEEIREMEKRVYRTSFSGGWRSGVISGADRLTNQASNAFLKTLEEPPAQCVFFLITDNPDGLLPTIRSRCQIVALEQACGAGVSEAVSSFIVKTLGDFIPGDSLTALLAAERWLGYLKDERSRIEEELKAQAEEDIDDDILNARVSSAYREKRQELMKAAALWFRDVMVLCQDLEKATGLYYRDAIEILRRQIPSAGYPAARGNLERIDDINRQLERNLPDTFVLQNGLVQMK